MLYKHLLAHFLFFPLFSLKKSNKFIKNWNKFKKNQKKLQIIGERKYSEL